MPHESVTVSSVASATRWRATATKITSIRKTTVVSKAARLPTTRVMREGSLDVPFDPRRRMKSDARRVRKVSAAAGDNQ